MIVYTNPDLNNSIPEICECKGCKFPATRNCKTIPLPEQVWLCDHCAIDLEWHGVIERYITTKKVTRLTTVSSSHSISGGFQ